MLPHYLTLKQTHLTFSHAFLSRALTYRVFLRPATRSYSAPLGVHISLLHTIFSPVGGRRNGTPRQPLLVPLARCRLRLVSDVPAATLAGLEQYSHVWVLYIFHENTDLVKVWQGDRSGLKAKVAVPRLNGERMGVLATRSPHRPVPIGLSVAQV